MPVDAALAVADHLWKTPIPFRARKRSANVHLRATNARWERGSGPLAEGPIESILLFLTGRHAGAGGLCGDGASILKQRL
jgi:hypothetical protein